MSTAIEKNGTSGSHVIAPNQENETTDYDGMKPIGFDEWLDWYMENESVVSKMIGNRKRCVMSAAKDTLVKIYRSVGLKKYSETHMGLTGLLICMSDENYFGARATRTVESMAQCTMIQFANWSGIDPVDLDVWTSLENSVKLICDRARSCESDLDKYRRILDAVNEALAID